MNIKAVKKAVKEQTTKARSAWGRGVAKYALDLIEGLEERKITDLTATAELERECLNGAEDWRQYSEGGCALCYDEDIAVRLCSPSEIKKYYHGNPCGKRPNEHESSWLETQARALFQAFRLIYETIEDQETPTRVIDRTSAA